MLRFENATAADIPLIRDIASRTWWPAYGSILSAEQIQYMLNHIYAPDALQKVMDEQSQSFILLYDRRGGQGFAAYGPRKQDAGVYKLHKLYVLPQTQGRGYGHALIHEVKGRVAHAGARALELNVNRYNPAKDFYARSGFRIIAEEDIPIGPYWMNDYVMRMDFV